MKQKKLIIFVITFWVIVFLAVFGKKWLRTDKPMAEPARVESPVPEEKFEYVKVSVLGKDVECKYARFDPPLKVNRLKGIVGVDPNTKIQWLQFLKYTTDISDSSRKFNPEMQNSDRKDRVDFQRENWSKVLASDKKLADALLQQQKEINIPLEGVIKGIMFLRQNQLEHVIFNYDYQNDSHSFGTGELAILHEKKLTLSDDEVYKLDYKLIANLSGSGQAEVIEKLSQSEHGILTVKDPLNWNLR